MASVAALAVVYVGITNPNGLAETPPMGWRSWNFMKQDVSQSKILAQVDALVARRKGNPSLLELGYNHIGIDDGWQACGAGVNHSFHNQQGQPIINLTRFPDMLAMNREAHSKGVKMGWYANNCGCNEKEQFGSIGGHVRQDAQAAADLEFDSLKVDGCGPSQNISVWTAELNATGRPILLEDCLTKKYTRQGLPAPIPLKEIFIECPGNFFRLGSDIAPQFLGTMYNVIYTYNFMLPYQQPDRPASRPGCWTYNDMLEVGVNLTFEESRTHFAAWVVTSSPLVLGFDITNPTIYDEVYPIIGNKLAISINQQWAGLSGQLVRNSTATFSAATAHGASGKVPTNGKANVTYPVWMVWRKPLVVPSGGEAVLVINLSDSAVDVAISFKELGLASGVSSVTDVWTGQAVHTAGTDGLDLKGIEPHDSVFYVLTPT